jgi:hypothetical protein
MKHFLYKNIFNKKILAFLLFFFMVIQLTIGSVIFPFLGKVKKTPAVVDHFLGLYTQLNLANLGLSFQAYDLAMQGFCKLSDKGKFKRDPIISIIDFSKPSSAKRLFIIDLKNQTLLFNTLVAHGKNSGNLFAQSFSNEENSLKSSLGFFETGATYIGKNGLSLVLNGLEKGFNNNALERAIVLHGAEYVSEEVVNTQGRLGRSFGCPAVPLPLSKKIINTIKNGTCIFIYSPNQKYISKSPVLNS